MLDRTVKTVATVAAVAVAAFAAAGVADAGTRPDDRPMRGPGAIALTNEWVAAESAGRPDDRATHGPGAIAAARRDVVLRPDDRGDRRLPNTVSFMQPTTRNRMSFFRRFESSRFRYSLRSDMSVTISNRGRFQFSTEKA